MDQLLLKKLTEYIEANYVGDFSINAFNSPKRQAIKKCQEIRIKNFDLEKEYLSEDSINQPRKKESNSDAIKYSISPSGLSDIFENISLDESFSEMVLRKIDEKGIRDVECYSKANIDRRHFSKIRSDKNYRTTKQTALALAIALELPINESEDLLKKAGFALSNSDIGDMIVKYCIENKLYDLKTIDEYLIHFDQKPLCKY